MRRLLKWLGIVLLGLLVLILLAFGALAFLGGTERGFNLVTREVAKRVDGLELGTFEGSLRSGVRTEALSFANDTLQIEARGVDTAWRLGCLAGREFCLDRAVVDELDIATFAGDEPPAETPAGEIRLPSIALPIDLSAKEVLIRKLRFRPPGEAPEQVLENVRLSARTEGGRVLLDDASVSYGTYDAKLAGEITLDGDYPLDLELGLDLGQIVPENLLSSSGTGADPGADPSADPSADPEPNADTAPDVDTDADPGSGNGRPTRDVRVAVALGNTLRELDVAADVSGALEARLDGRVEPLDPDLPASLELSVPVVGFPLDTRSQVRANELRIGVDGTLDDYALTLATEVSGEQVPATGIELAGKANTERLLVSDLDIDTLGGTIDGNAALSWVDGTSWTAELDLAGIDPSVQFEALPGELGGTLRASGGVADGNWTLDLNRARIEGTLQGRPFTFDAALAKGADDVFRIERLALDNGENRVRASGTVDDTWDIAANAALPQLQSFVPGLAGGFSADVALSGPLAEPNVSVAASSNAVTLNDLAIEGLSLKANIARAGLEPSTLNLAVGEVRAGGQTIANARLGLDGTRAGHRLTLFADGPSATSIDLDASGALDERFDWAGSLDAVTLEVPAHVIRLREPVALAWDNAAKRFAIDPHCWVSEESDLCLENEVVADADGRAVVTLDRYLLGRLDPFLPARSTLQGALAAEATVLWGEAQPGGFTADIALSIDDGGATVVDANDDPVTFAYDSLTLDAEIDPTDVAATLAISSRTMGEAQVALRIDPAGEQKPIDGEVDLSGFRIDFVQTFLPDFEEISGTVNASGELSGVLTDPRFDGEIVLADPVVRSETLPLSIDGGEVTTIVRGKRAFVEGELESGEGGSIAIEGSANWQQLDAWRVGVELIGRDLTIRQEPLTESTVHHEITISARPGQIRIGGDVDVPSASIDVRELPKGAATLSDDIVIIEDIPETPVEETAATPAPGGLELLVDIGVSLGDEVALDAYGLQARLTGDMSISLRSPNPVQLGGEIRVVDGIYKQYGQNLEASGQIIFVGPVDRTALDIEAIRRIDTEEPERIAGLKITGDVASPDVALFTEPADKSEEAILSYIVLGRDIGETSDQEANLLATAALALTVRGGRSIGAGIAGALGIEDFALETRGRGEDTELVVSGRLNDRLLLRYGQNVFNPGANTLYLRYDITKKLYLEAAQGLNDAVDLIYQFSF